MSNWVLEEKGGIKYYRLQFNDNSFENLICLFFTRVGGLDFLLEQTKKFNNDLIWISDNFGIKNINILKQIHSDKIYYIAEHNHSKELLEGDGMYTDYPNVFLGIRVADCLPIYFFIPKTNIIGLVHSGWQGTLNKIGLRLAGIIHDRYQIKYDQIQFAFGPAIGGCCYEIKEDVVAKFNKLIQEYKISNAIIYRNQKIFLDLQLINKTVLESVGMNNIGNINLCTFCNTNLFYSARKDNTNRRNLALIGYKI